MKVKATTATTISAAPAAQAMRSARKRSIAANPAIAKPAKMQKAAAATIR